MDFGASKRALEHGLHAQKNVMGSPRASRYSCEHSLGFQGSRFAATQWQGTGQVLLGPTEVLFTHCLFQAF